jgi:hypothetical protein
MLNGKWKSVRKDAPCPICGKPDWCQVSTDGRAAICRRSDAGKAQKGGGSLHQLDGRGDAAAVVVSSRPSLPPRATRTDLHLLAQRFATSINPARLARLGEQLGVTAASLVRLDVGWSVERSAWTFPMRDETGNVLGIRIRTTTGRKFAVTGGREGLFIPRDLDGPRLFVCEGPTDTAALLDLEFAAIGRPSCMGGRQIIVDMLRRRHKAGDGIDQLVIVADGDGPGQRGAEQLAGVARLYCGIVQLVTPPPPFKDMRAWKQGGATAADVERAVWGAPRWEIRVASTLEGATQ